MANHIKVEVKGDIYLTPLTPHSDMNRDSILKVLLSTLTSEDKIAFKAISSVVFPILKTQPRHHHKHVWDLEGLHTMFCNQWQIDATGEVEIGELCPESLLNTTKKLSCKLKNSNKEIFVSLSIKFLTDESVVTHHFLPYSLLPISFHKMVESHFGAVEKEEKKKVKEMERQTRKEEKKQLKLDKKNKNFCKIKDSSPQGSLADIRQGHVPSAPTSV